VSEPLRITSVHASTFGGLRDVSVEFGDQPFIVISGPNESGKSSLTTLLTWLLVGPTGDAAFAQRFGNSGDIIGGSLEAHLGGDRVEAVGGFKVPKSGTPNQNGLTVNLRAKPYTADAWRREVLRGIDSTVARAVYTMAGIDLHNGDETRKGIAALAVTGVAGANKVPEVLGGLRKRTTDAVKSGAANAVSFKSLTKNLKAASQRSLNLKTDVRDYLELQGKLEQQKLDSQGLQRQVTELRDRLEAIKTAGLIIADGESLAAIEEAIANLDPIAADWMAVVEVDPSFPQCVRDLAQADAAVGNARADFDSACRVANLDADEAERIQVSSVENTEITTLKNALVACRTDEERIAGEVRELERVETECGRARDGAIESCQGLDIVALQAVHVDDDAQTTITEAIGKLGSAEQDVETANVELRKAKGDVENARSAHERASADWDRFNPTTTAESWLMAPGSPAAARSGAQSMFSSVMPFVVAAVVIVVAVLAFGRIIAAVVALLAIVGAIVVARLGSPAGVGNSAASDPAVRIAAMAVRDAHLVVNNALAAVDTRDQALRQKQSDLDEAAGTAARLTAAAGFDAPGTASSRRSLVKAVLKASAALSAFHKAEEETSLARDRAAAAATQSDSARDALVAALARCGIPGRFDAQSAAAEIAAFETVTRRSSELGRMETVRQEAKDALDQVAAPIASAVDGLSLEQMLEQFDAALAVARAEAELDSNRTALMTALKAHPAQHPAATELAMSFTTAELLAGHQEDLNEQIGGLDKKRSLAQQEIGALEHELKEAEKQEKLSAIQLEIGEIEEQRDEVLVDAAATAVAAMMLGQVAEELRERHQSPLITRATDHLQQVVPQWQQLRVDHTADGGVELSVRHSDGQVIAVSRLSTGAQGLVYLALRLAAAEQDAESNRGGLRFPILCDDPLVHFDDQRAAAAMKLLAAAAQSGHQVIVFTCHGRTTEAAESAGAATTTLGA